MALYDVQGNKIFDDDRHLVDTFDIIHTFTAFDTDYATSSSAQKVLDISPSEFLAIFYDPYVGQNSNGVWVGKTLKGKDASDTYDIYAYEFRPRNYDRTIILSSAMHPQEMPASFGLARWFKEYMESTDESFAWLREHLRIIAVPMVNPWGFAQSPKTYGNANGVNPNRNYDTLDSEWESYPVYTDEWNQKGSAAYSEPETQILRDLAYSYADTALFYLDCHTGYRCSRASYGDVWSYYLDSNPNYNKIRNACTALKTHISETYGVTATEHHTNPSTDPALNEKFWSNMAGIPMIAIEQCHYSDTSYQTVPNNSAAAICEYATQIHAYIIAQLQSE